MYYTIEKKNITCCSESSLIVRKYSGSHRKLRPAAAEYELNDG